MPAANGTGLWGVPLGHIEAPRVSFARTKPLCYFAGTVSLGTQNVATYSTTSCCS